MGGGDEAAGEVTGSVEQFFCDLKKGRQEGISKVTFEHIPEGYLGQGLVMLGGRELVEACRNRKEASLAEAKGAVGKNPERAAGH